MSLTLKFNVKTSRRTPPRQPIVAFQPQGQQKTEQSSQQKKSDSAFDSVQERLLKKAATRLDRGVTTCLVCKGAGDCSCPKCAGRGATAHTSVTSRSHSSVEGILSKISNSLGLGDGRLSGSPDYLQTNRCAACRGAGWVTCQTCEGKGLRGPPNLVANFPTRSKSSTAKI